MKFFKKLLAYSVWVFLYITSLKFTWETVFNYFSIAINSLLSEIKRRFLLIIFGCLVLPFSVTEE